MGTPGKADYHARTMVRQLFENHGLTNPRRPPKPPRLIRPGKPALVTMSVLPTFFTLGNLLCGFAAIFLASRPLEVELPLGWTPLAFSAAMIFLGMAFDGLDGRIARLTRSTSDLGAQLDSMADMVTFGVAPAFLAVELIGVRTPFVSATNDLFFDRFAMVVASIYVACAALRLARFNIESAQAPETHHRAHFKGLPSPGAAGTVASMALLHQHFLAGDDDPMQWPVRLAAIGMVLVMLLAAFAMVSRFHYVHVLNRYLRGRAPFSTLWKTVVAVLILFIYPQGSLAAAFVLYALSAPAQWAWQRFGFEPRPTSPGGPWPSGFNG